MKLTTSTFVMSVLCCAPAYAETIALAPAATKAIAVAGDAGNPTFTAQDVGATYEVRARDFASGAVRNNVVYLRFDLSALTDVAVDAASLVFNRVAGDTLTTGRFAVYGLGDDPLNLPQSWTAATFLRGAEFDPAMFYDAAASSGACPVDLTRVVDFSQQEVVSGDVATLSSPDFVAFLQARADAGGQATILLGMPSQGAGNDKKITYAFPGYTDPARVVSLALSFTQAGLPPPGNVGLASMTLSAAPSVTVEWDPVDGAIVYDVYRRKSGEADATLVETTSLLGYVDTDVALFETYYYSVDVITPEEQSAPSAEIEVRLIDESLGPPVPPQALRTTSVSPASISLAWDAVPGAIFYELHRSTEADGVFARVQTLTDPGATDSDALRSFRGYSYRLKTVGAGGVSRFGETLTVPPRFTPGRPPQRPRDVSISSRGPYSVEVAWSASTNAEGYYVYRAPQHSAEFTLVGIAETNALSDGFAVYPDAGYRYVVYAVGGAGYSLPSNPAESAPLVERFRRVEALDRAPVVVPAAEGVLVSWRLLGTDRRTTGFHVYRDGRRLNSLPLWGATNYLDVEGSVASTYEVRTSLGLLESSENQPALRLPDGYLSIPIEPPPAGVTPDGLGYSYAANDASAADLDGDGDYEIILKWDPTNSRDNADDGYTGNVYLDAYTLEGDLLWRVDLGHNVRAGAHYTPFVVYDFDGDGLAEMLCRTADATVDGTGTVLGDAIADHRNAAGRVLTGPERLTLFDGLTGAALHTVDYVPQRGSVGDWGDAYGNRVDRFNAGVAYLDGVRPSAFFARGYYRGQIGMGAGITVVAAFDVQDRQIVPRWTFDTRSAGNGSYVGQGNHQVVAGDGDGDGKDEVVIGSLVLDDDGSVLYGTGLGHGDAMHFGDLDPRRPGLELFAVKEDPAQPYQSVLTDAATGAVVWGVFNGTDTGRGLAADIDPSYAGSEAWGAANASVWSARGDLVGSVRPSMNFAVFWDGDALRELLDQTRVRKWDWVNQRELVLLDAVGTASNNGTKATPCLQADLLGDWREEVVLRSADDTELRVYTTSAATQHRIPSLMHDLHYRAAVAAQNSGYNQPPQPSFFIGNGMASPPTPNVFVDPVPELVALQRSGESYVGPVVVVLAVNLQPALHNEYSVDRGAWRPYVGPFVVGRPGPHGVAFRTLDPAGAVLAEAARPFTVRASTAFEE